MASVGDITHDIASRRADRESSVDYLRYTIPLSNDEWNTGYLVVPADILDAYIIRCTVYCINVATVHEVDPTSLREVGQLWVRSQAGGDRGVHMSEPLAGFAVGTATTPPDSWQLEFRDVEEHITRDDGVGFVFPPCDDHATTATGDYIVWLTLRVKKYTKK